MSAEQRLDGIQARHGEWYGDGEFYIGPPATWGERDPGESKERYIVRCDVPDMIAALRAVLELHSPTHYMDGEQICNGCDDGQLDPPSHPCRTRRAIEETLGEGQ